MKRPLYRRALNFETMEQRLTLSTNSGGEYVNTSLDFSNASNLLEEFQGGLLILDFNQTATAGSFAELGVDRDRAFLFLDRFTPIRPDLSLPSGNGLNSLQEPGSAVHPAPIVQPHLGKDELPGGLVSLIEVFAPSVQAKHALQSIQRETGSSAAVTTSVDAYFSSTTEQPLARGRDVYFEVASVKSEMKLRHEEGFPTSREEIVPSNFTPPTSPEPASSGHAVPHPAVPRPQTTNDAAPHAFLELLLEKNTQDELPDVSSNPEKKVASVNRDDDDIVDTAFAEWAETDALVESGLPLRDSNGKEHQATWPIAVVLAGTELMVRQRRFSKSRLQQMLATKKHS